ncbi:hypothetical protein AMAG_06063 [Allomyces macrogynus ATCC 38327]|uniref:Uncharacterized protein n=1 Tax=Allomyces macrogynus (strain ATCC 38327) TaxID=578462 RepID=A0A0L0SE39_ALLM3|nr:hypothetical protein AMAG_06063 [Allomyces macrogynus ATCC 38327]|eukprot:KNE60699.1 hypothetical protein AMAG_06063 [Allomyces macrogynus ATCC 38327]
MWTRGALYRIPELCTVNCSTTPTSTRSMGCWSSMPCRGSNAQHNSSPSCAPAIALGCHATRPSTPECTWHGSRTWPQSWALFRSASCGTSVASHPSKTGRVWFRLS